MPASPVLPREIAHPLSPAGRVDPLPAYRWLHEHAPVYHDPAARVWLLTGHAACSAALRDPRFSAAASQRRRRRADPLPSSMLTTDPPEHQRLRAPGALLLGPAAIDSIMPTLGADLDALLEPLVGEVDATTAIGGPLPLAVYCRLFGIDGTQRAEFAELAAAAAVNVDPMADAQTVRAGRAAMGELREFLDVHARTAPACPLRRLIDEAPLNRDEVLGILGLALVGGWQPLADFVGNALFALLSRPADIRRLAAAGDGPGGGAGSPDSVDARVGVDEVLRLYAPIPFTARMTTTDVDLDGVTIGAGSMVLVLISAANRDPAVFDDPDELLLDRTPNPHLAFGSGMHFCLAAPLVRAVGARLLPRLAARSPRLAHTGRRLVWDGDSTLRRLRACPIVLDRKPAARGM